MYGCGYLQDRESSGIVCQKVCCQHTPRKYNIKLYSITIFFGLVSGQSLQTCWKWYLLKFISHHSAFILNVYVYSLIYKFHSYLSLIRLNRDGIKLQPKQLKNGQINVSYSSMTMRQIVGLKIMDLVVKIYLFLHIKYHGKNLQKKF